MSGGLTIGMDWQGVAATGHVLAVLSLLTIVAGISPLLLGSRSPVAVYTHAYCMTWSYAG